jgi:Zn-finger nucleic acid-binding protein
VHCPRDGASLVPIAIGATEVARCPTCRGVLADAAGVEALVGEKVLSRAAEVTLDDAGPPCPRCAAPMRAEEARGAVGHTLFVCGACARTWIDEDALAALRARRPSTTPTAARAPTASAHDEAGEKDEAEETEASPFAPGPVRELLALGALFGLAWLTAAYGVGESLAFLVRMQFHELGHALVAWSTGRRALPLPIGVTSWSLDRSSVLVSAEVTFVALLAVWSVREKRRGATITAAVLGAVLAVGLLVPLDASEPWLVAGGHVGEIVLPALAMLAFHAPLPARARWDFWRWALALVAVFPLAWALRDDLAIGAGTRALPSGSFITGDAASGDIERLLADHGWTEDGLRALFAHLASIALAIGVLPHPIVLGVRWLRARSRARTHEHAA